MNSIPGISAEHSDQILALFKALPEKTQILLFGSRAKGNFREGSDIDIAVKGGSFGLDERNLILLKYDELNLPWKLDIVVYSLITDSALKEHIDRIGKPLIVRR